jgi:hypothetical protein
MVNTSTENEESIFKWYKENKTSGVRQMSKQLYCKQRQSTRECSTCSYRVLFLYFK